MLTTGMVVRLTHPERGNGYSQHMIALRKLHAETDYHVTSTIGRLGTQMVYLAEAPLVGLSGEMFSEVLKDATPVEPDVKLKSSKRGKT